MKYYCSCNYLKCIACWNKYFYLKKGIQEWELAPPAKDVQPPQQIVSYVKELRA